MMSGNVSKRNDYIVIAAILTTLLFLFFEYQTIQTQQALQTVNSQRLAIQEELTQWRQKRVQRVISARSYITTAQEIHRSRYLANNIRSLASEPDIASMLKADEIALLALAHERYEALAMLEKLAITMVKGDYDKNKIPVLFQTENVHEHAIKLIYSPQFEQGRVRVQDATQQFLQQFNGRFNLMENALLKQLDYYRFISYALLVVALGLFMIRIIGLSKQRLRFESLQAIANAKSEFMTLINHELRTPLNGLQGMFSHIDEKRLPISQQRLVYIGRKSYSHLQNVINKLLVISDIQDKEIILSKEPTDIVQLLKRALAFVDSERQIHTKVYFDVAQCKHRVWLVDSNKLFYVAKEILQNALKNTQSGFVKVSLSHTDNAIELVVRDTGKGMSEATIQRTLTPFENTSDKTPDQATRMGVGLFICRNFISLCGGQLKITSEIDEGSTVTVTLPAEVSTTPLDTPSNTISEEHKYDGKILLVEDNEINQTVFLFALRRYANNIFVVNNGQEGVNFVKTEKPDVIFMDIHMPVMNGVDAFKTIKADYPDIPIIALTADGTDKQKHYYLNEIGFDGFVSKPVSPQDLLSHLPD